jgi:AcrR family transcriptional regulator
MMRGAIERVALALFDEHGFDAVTVDQIATNARVSARTFYRYFPNKEDVLQAKVDRWAEALRVALEGRPDDEPPLRSLRLALEEVAADEDPTLLRRWITVIASTPSVIMSVIGGIQLKNQRVIAEFLGERLGAPSDDRVPVMLAAAVGGVIQAAHTEWLLNGGDFPSTLAAGIEVLERGIGSDPAGGAGVDSGVR